MKPLSATHAGDSRGHPMGGIFGWELVLSHCLGWGPTPGLARGTRGNNKRGSNESCRSQTRCAGTILLLAGSFVLVHSHKATTKLARNSKKEGKGKPRALFVLKLLCLARWKAASYQNTALLHPPPAGDAQAVERR